MRKAWYLLLALAVIAADQLTKLAVRLSFSMFESRPILGDLVRLTYIKNLGAGFSFSLGSPDTNRLLFSAVSLIIAIYLTWLVVHARHAFPAICFSLIIGGALGNLVDRLTLGGVTDFIDIDFPDFIMHRWPVFNVADSAIVVGVTLFIIYSLFIERKQPTGDAEYEISA